MNEKERRYDIDWIRDITVLLIIFFHSLIIFFTRESAIMFVRSGYNLDFCIGAEAILSRIMMPILFILAGFSVKYSLKNRTTKEFIVKRFRKLFLPLLIGSLTLNPIVSYMYGRSQGRDISFIDHFIKFVTSMSEDFNGLTTGYSPMHFWFLLYLFVFSIICMPIFLKYKNKRSAKESTILTKRGILLLAVIPYVLIFCVDILDEMNPIGYLYLFLFGYFILTKDEVRSALKRDKWIYTILAILMLSGCLFDWFVYRGYNPIIKIILIICNKGSRIVAPLAIIALCDNKVVNRKSRVLSYLNGANFPIYIYHMVLLTAVGYLVLAMPFGPWVKFILINVITYTCAFLFYECYRFIKNRMIRGNN